jgi:dUTP pyrophosphatase
MELVFDLSSVMFQLFPTAPRTTISLDDASRVYVHTGHCYEGQPQMISVPIADEKPTQEEISRLADEFERQRQGRVVYSFVGSHLVVAKDNEAFHLITFPVFLPRAELTPKVVYRGANNLPLPTYATASSVGFDIAADTDVTIPAHGTALVKTGLFLDPAEWDKNSPCYLRIAPKSGLAVKSKLGVLAGVVDCDYPDEIGVVLINHSDSDRSFAIGEKIAQGIWEVAIHGGNLPVARTTRTGGFGSTN